MQDFNKDGHLDLMVLFSQAYEGISIFYNDGKGNFTEENILSFPPVYGLSYFEIVDFNKDGLIDILITNGDNWDYSAIKKPYHGIRIFLNNGKNKFKEKWFYPLNGASKAIAKDFDGDGDLDIAATSFYDDLELPEHGFVYLENEGNFNFKTKITKKAEAGKWMVMESCDYDLDGDLDIVLGSYFQSATELTKLIFKGVSTFPDLLVLENKKN